MNDSVSPAAKLGSAVFYALASILITTVNKSVLTSYNFPSANILSLGQMACTIVVLFIAKLLGFVSFPRLSRDLPRRIFPLPIFTLANSLLGLNATQALSIPMFTVLRRFSILMTMILELWMLGTKPNRFVVLSVFIMIFGALIAAANDLAFDFLSYAFIFGNNLSTAANGVYTKMFLNKKDLGKYGLLFYNALFGFPLVALLCHQIGQRHIDKAIEFEGWSNPMFCFKFFVSCMMGLVLNFAVVLCTQLNTSLTTTVVGCLKNISIAYYGMLYFPDYVFSMLNFVGINISILGSLLYSYVAFKTDKKSLPTHVRTSKA
ncbi:unnamed protein product [Oikopleura dioica]|uniref:Sugar phosphate transporter domain-containing protein n=1 Tax=Oikopleura dioica TaxID=34765 RepID=E4Y9L0_OIKDI|nr:unnamed protein product [Oikopleura dioica]